MPFSSILLYATIYKNTRKMFKFPPLTPETIIMLPWAVMLDAIPWLLLLLGVDDFGILDFVGIITIGLWLFLRKGKTSGLRGKGKGPTGIIRRLFTGRYLKFLTPFVNEIIPYWGTIMPSWTLSVYFNLTE
mgnify:CR=1 FL=1